MQKIKKTMVILLLVLSAAFLAGWGKKVVELLNDTPLIDLSKAIKEAPVGNQGNTLKTEEKEPESDGIMAEDERERPLDNKTEMAGEKKEPYRIKIRDMTITYKNRRCNSLDTLKDNLIRDCSDGAGSVYLEDDFAEAHVYKDVLALLEQLHETIGLAYTFE